MAAVIIIILILLIALLSALFMVYYKVFYSPHRDADEVSAPMIIANKRFNDEVHRQTLSLKNIPCRRVMTRSYDGLRLYGRYYHHEHGAPLCILFHGYRGSAIRDFSVMGQFLQNEGYNVLLVDERAHFKSGGHTITYGIRERRDVLSWIEYANRRFGTDAPVYLFGISMGAGTVLMASGLELPDNVKLICADCPFSSPKDIICHVAKKTGWNPKVAWVMSYLSVLVFGHLVIRGDVTAAESVKRSKKPILIIHGEADDFVPPEMSDEIRRANPELVERHTFPGAGHGVSYFADPERYLAIVRDFIKRNG